LSAVSHQHLTRDKAAFARTQKRSDIRYFVETPKALKGNFFMKHLLHLVWLFALPVRPSISVKKYIPGC
jgi:hypothetical protein